MLKKSDVARLWLANFRFVASVLATVSPEIGELGLDTKALLVLAAIDEHPHPAALATSLSLPKPTVTLYLKQLDAAGFIVREIDAEDLRRHRLGVTAAGRKVITRGNAIIADAVDARLARLDQDELQAFGAIMDKLARPD